MKKLREITCSGELREIFASITEKYDDIGEIIISDEKIKCPASYKEILHTLGEVGVLPETFARKIEPVAGFRNVLVNMYAKVELDRLYENLQNCVEDMELFVEYIAQFLAEEKN